MAIFVKKLQFLATILNANFFGNFLTFKWQFYGGSDPAVVTIIL